MLLFVYNTSYSRKYMSGKQVNICTCLYFSRM